MFGVAEMSLRRIIICCSVFLSIFLRANASVGQWKNYTDMKSIRSLATDGKVVWAGTSGGIFRFDPSDSSFQKYTNSEGLTSNSVTAIFVDSQGKVWVGLESGIIDVYDPARQRWISITDITKFSSTSKVINGFYQAGDKLYIHTAFGVSIFSVSKFEFSDTYTNFASISQPVVNAVRVFQDKIFLATDHGILASKTGALNLSSPGSWEISSSNASVNSLETFNGDLYGGSVSGFMKFQNSSWNVIAGIGGVTKIIALKDSVLLLTESNQLKSFSVTGTITGIGSPFSGTVVSGAVTDKKEIFLGFDVDGVGALNGTTQQWEKTYPNGPYSNFFYRIVVDNDNVLWAASGGIGAGVGNGFYSFNGSIWRNYNRSNTPLLLSNSCFTVDIGPNNSKWFGTWGEGLVVVNSKGDVVRQFDYDYPGFIGVVRSGTNIPSYTVPCKIAVGDSNGVWVAVFASVDDKKVLWKMKSDSTWISFPGSPYGIPSFMFDVIIDDNNTKWFTNAIVGRAPGSVSVVFFNENNKIRNTINGWGVLSESDGLTNKYIYAIVKDKSGDLWLGTANGISIITNSLSPADHISRVFQPSVRDQQVNCIAIDALNNKWVGTTQGIFVLSPDGSQLLNQYTMQNTDGKLIDDNIYSIAYDQRKGVMYFATEKGLSSLEIAAISSSSSLSNVDLSPNPVYLEQHASVEIRGLVDDCVIKVLTVTGKVIKQFAAQGAGRAFWDCRDDNGNNVGSGIYIVVALDQKGSQVGAAKVAVIRK